MNYTGVVRGFGSYTPAQREQLKRDLSLSFSDTLLAFCMSHYKNAEKRDPYIDELQMLSALSETLSRDCAALCVSELFTNDTFALDTYRDLLQKKKVLNPRAPSFLSLREIPSVAPRYLLRAGKRKPRTSYVSYPEYLRDLAVSPTALCVAPRHSPFRLRMSCTTASAPSHNDVLVLLVPSPRDTVYRHARKCERLFDDPGVYTLLSDVFPVGTGGMLRELLEVTDGLSIDLPAFSPLDTEAPATVLTGSFEGCRILRVATAHLTPLLRKIAEHGMDAFPFAQFTKDKKYTFVRGHGTIFSIQSAFLCSLFEKKPITAMLPSEADTSPDAICHRATNASSCAYLRRGKEFKETVSIGDVTACAVSAIPEKSFFKTALLASVAPLVTMALCGKDYTEGILCTALELPSNVSDPTVAGACVSMLLGTYRAQAELSLVSCKTTIRTAEIGRPSISVFSYAQTPSLTSTLSAEGGRIYCLSFPFDENGLPHFSSLRVLLREIAALAREGHISSARILLGESIGDGLADMKGELTPDLTDETIDPDKRLPLAVLIESTAALPYRPVAISEKEEIPRSSDLVSLPLDRALLWAGTPEITLLCHEYDSDAAALASLLSHRGAKVHLFSPDEEDLLPLSRAILTSQLFILCRGVKLPEDARVSVAVDFFKKNGGHTLSFAKADAEDDICLENGISDALFESFFSNH